MTNRKKPFSGKAKKAQLRAKRERHKLRDQQNDLDSQQRLEDENVNTTRQPEYLLPPSTSYTHSGYIDLRTKVRMEPKRIINARKRDATRPLVIMHDEMKLTEIYTTYGLEKKDNQLPMFKKPHWINTMTLDELNDVDENAYNSWITQLHDIETMASNRSSNTSANPLGSGQLNLFERNLDVWRQLWRVIERSHILVHLADIRCPLLHISDQLLSYLATEFPNKRVIIALTKCDLVNESRINAWASYLQSRYSCVNVVAYKGNFKGPSPRDTTSEVSKQNNKQIEESNKIFMQTIDQIIPTIPTSNDNSQGILAIGFIGEPNVGKSSLQNCLLGRKLVSVSATPGHTKHLQTHFLDSSYSQRMLLQFGKHETFFKRIMFIDCPGVIFPRLNIPLSLQIIFGSFPIAQTREPFSAIRFIAEHCNPSLDSIYKLAHVEEDDGDWSPYTICESYAQQHGFHVKGGQLDAHRAANIILREALCGKRLVVSFPPPEGSETLRIDMEEKLSI